MTKKREIIITLLEFTALPTLRGLASRLARKDADDIGSDDRLARVLNNAADEIQRYLDEWYDSQPA